MSGAMRNGGGTFKMLGSCTTTQQTHVAPARYSMHQQHAECVRLPHRSTARALLARTGYKQRSFISARHRTYHTKTATSASTSDTTRGIPKSYGGVASSKSAEIFDAVILSNGPGEVAGWVKPTVRALRKRFERESSTLRISVVLAPCPHASNQEAAFVRSCAEVDRCQEPRGLYRLLLTGTAAFEGGFAPRGVVIYLGGDQFNAIALGWQLGYPTLIYSENAVLWPQFATRYLLREPSLLQAVPSKFHRRCTITGDLFLDAVADGQSLLDGGGGGEFAPPPSPSGGAHNVAEASPASQMSPQGALLLLITLGFLGFRL